MIAWQTVPRSSAPLRGEGVGVSYGCIRSEHSRQSVLDLDFGLPAEDLSCARDVRLTDRWVVDGKRGEADFTPRDAGDAMPFAEQVVAEVRPEELRTTG
jgi:hypothetical protein